VIRIDDRVWSVWQAQIDDGFEPAIMMRVSTALDREAAVQAVRESVDEVYWPRLAEYDASPEQDPPRPGEWDWLGVPGGVLVSVSDCYPFKEMMTAFAEALERRGVEGAIEVPRWRPEPQPPPLGHVLRCHLRVVGHRVGSEPPEPPWFNWEPEPRALAAILETAVGWCKRLSDAAAYSVIKSPLGPVPWEGDDDLLAPMSETIDEGGDGMVEARAEGRWRQAGVEARHGGVGLAVGGSDLDGGVWRPAFEELTSMLRDNAHLLVYGYVRRGRFGGVRDDPLQRDWPTRPDAKPYGTAGTQWAFEDVFAPDPFAVQLLGPGYTGRVPDAPSYRREQVGDGATLLEHVDPAAWFDDQFPPDKPPPVLAKARRELAPILYTPGALHRGGYTDVPDLARPS
jgi:hypothetical protein